VKRDIMLHPASLNNEQAAMLISLGIGLVGMFIIYLILHYQNRSRKP